MVVLHLGKQLLRGRNELVVGVGTYSPFPSPRPAWLSTGPIIQHGCGEVIATRMEGGEPGWLRAAWV